MTTADMQEILSVLPIARNNFQKYSTQEQIVGEWIDGKPVYQITLTKEFTAAQNKTWQSFSEFDISGKNFIDVNYFLVDSNTFTAFGRDSYVTSSATASSMYRSANVILRENALQVYVAYVDAQNVTVYVTLKYTKTTD